MNHHHIVYMDEQVHLFYSVTYSNLEHNAHIIIFGIAILFAAYIGIKARIVERSQKHTEQML